MGNVYAKFELDTNRKAVDEDLELEDVSCQLQVGRTGGSNHLPIQGGALNAGDEDDGEDTISSIGEEDFDLDDAAEGEELDDPDVDAAEMAKQLAELEKKDPEFYKYLRENDADLLTFGQEEEEAPVKKSKKHSKAQAVEESEDDEEMDYDGADSDSDEEEPEFDGIPAAAEPEKISVTMKMLRGWQRAMIEQKSLRSLRKMVLAFRAAAHMNEEGDENFETRYKVDSALGEYSFILLYARLRLTILASRSLQQVDLDRVEIHSCRVGQAHSLQGAAQRTIVSATLLFRTTRF